MPAPDKVHELVKRFKDNYDSYHSTKYNETQVRREFIDPFFEALGWDIDNENGYAEAYKDVIHEDAVKVEGKSKAPDYSFRIGGTRKFFLEAKKPSVNIKGDIAPAFQLRRYGWSAKLSLSILTDFEELAVYDCRVKPEQGDKASVARIKYYRYDEFIEKWDEIENTFSREAVLKGSFDRYASDVKAKRGTSEVDDAFLKEIESWREVLAKNIALRNPELTQRELNTSVQKTIDRIIFLRICEDRQIEQYGTLREIAIGKELYSRLGNLFQRADDRYNSGLFHFKKEKGRNEDLDSFTLRLKIDDKPLKDILNSLYYPLSPYEFSVLPADILGQIYEQFLGKIIVLSNSHKATIEEKPEVKKAGGVYYTPTYIVSYIVENTLGKLLEGKTLNQISGNNRISPIRVLDPACGSGSFLIGAYQYLLDWYLSWYVSNGIEKYSKGKKAVIYKKKGLEWSLTTDERKRILLSHIYGVDIDVQAVEVTKLSLLLKTLEGENSESLKAQELFQSRILPDLEENIKSGNSLIGPDFYENQQIELFSLDDKYKVNAFNWNEEFPIIFKNGGFDAIIGNPPYILIEGEFRDDKQTSYYKRKYKTASYKLDTYHLFIEKSLKLLRTDGKCSMITPSNFLTNNYLSTLRKYMVSESNIEKILIFRDRVFPKVSVDTAIFICNKSAKSGESFFVYDAEKSLNGIDVSLNSKVMKSKVLDSESALFTGPKDDDLRRIITNLEDGNLTIGDIANVNFGKQLRDRKKYESDVISVANIDDIEQPYKACYTGKNIKRYNLEWEGLACLDIESARMGGCWDSDKQNARNKILTPQIGKWPEFALDTLGYQCLNTMFMIGLKDDSLSPSYLIGLLNSNVIRVIWFSQYYDKRGTYPKIKGSYLKKLPIPSSSGQIYLDMQQKIAQLAEKVIDLNIRLKNAKISGEKKHIHQEIISCERGIDQMVYRLFKLSQEEITLIEAATKSIVDNA